MASPQIGLSMRSFLNSEFAISASMMCVPILETEAYLSAFEKFNIDYLHMDIMDGEFVQNLSLAKDYPRFLRPHTKIAFDYHFMVLRPEEKMKWFDIEEGDIVSFHLESTYHPHRCVDLIKSRGAYAFVDINPGTPVNALDALMPDIDGVNIMTVDPGFPGLVMIESTLDKVRKLREMTDKVIETDGNMSYENIKRVRAAGADMAVCGTSAIMRGSVDDIEDNVRKTLDAAGRG